MKHLLRGKAIWTYLRVLKGVTFARQLLRFQNLKTGIGQAKREV
jgi:hypothetical protein